MLYLSFSFSPENAFNIRILLYVVFMCLLSAYFGIIFGDIILFSIMWTFYLCTFFFFLNYPAYRPSKRWSQYERNDRFRDTIDLQNMLDILYSCLACGKYYFYFSIYQHENKVIILKFVRHNGKHVFLIKSFESQIYALFYLFIYFSHAH